MSWVLRAMRRAKRVGQAERGGERQHRDRIGAAERGREHRDGRAQHVHVRIALRHHAPGGFGRDEGRLRRQPAGGFDARPQFPQRAEFGDGEKLVGIGGKAEEDHAPRRFERNALGFQRAQIGERDGEHEGQFLRLRAAGIVDHAPVGGGEPAAETLRGPSAARRRAKCGAASLHAPRPRRPVSAMRAERIVAETQARPSAATIRVSSSPAPRR